MKNIFKKILFLVFLTIAYPGIAQFNFHAYFGNLHSHTGLSDGVGTPEEAYRYARDTAGLDFNAVTDHLEQIDPIEWYNLILTSGQNTVNGSFVALYGYEWGSPLHGHTNVFNTNTLLFSVGWYYEDWDAFRQWVIENPPAFIEFNHPGDPSYATTWNNFDYMGGPGDSIFKLMEFQNPQQAADWYGFALNKGWHLSPVWNQDNHSADWGTKDNGRAGIWATGLTKTALIDAIIKRRTFATTDKNASIWLDVSGVSMGGTAQRLVNSPVHIVLSDENSETWTSIELVSQNGIAAFFESNSNPLDTVLLLSPDTDNWIFVRARQADGDYLWSAPVHFAGTINVGINNAQAADFKFYPNPVIDIITISLPENIDKNTICVFINDINGRQIKTLKYENITACVNQTSFSLRDIPCGFYFLCLSTGSFSIYKKLLILK